MLSTKLLLIFKRKKKKIIWCTDVQSHSKSRLSCTCCSERFKKKKKKDFSEWTDVHSPRLCEDVGVDVHHQVASCCVLHDKAHVLCRLEAGEQVDQEGMVRQVHDLEDALFTHETEERSARKRVTGGEEEEDGEEVETKISRENALKR